jgi:hypothetical protein
MNQQDAIDVARAFIATQPKDWQQVWPAKRIAAKLRQSRKSSEQVWEVRSVRDGLDVTNIFIEISPTTGTVLYAQKLGGLRELPEEYVATNVA